MTAGEPGEDGDQAVFEGFVEEPFEDRRVWRGGSGPAIIVIHEIPGLHPGVVDFARRLVAAGFTAYLPSLFGTPGRPYPEGMLGQVACLRLPRVLHVRARSDQPDRRVPASARLARPRPVRRARRRRGRDVPDRRIRAGHGGR